MYVCIVCVYVCVYECMYRAYICMHVCIHVCIYVIFKLGFERYGGNCPSWEGELSGGNCPGGKCPGPRFQVDKNYGRDTCTCKKLSTPSSYWTIQTLYIGLLLKSIYDTTFFSSFM